MNKLALMLTVLILSGCDGETVDPVTEDTSGAGFGPADESGPILYPDDGISNAVFSCSEASQRIRDGLELGMSKAEVRAIAGKPRHIALEGQDWRYGTGSNVGSGPTPDDFFIDYYFLPAANFTLFYLDDFSGDNTLCDNTDIAFVEAANSYRQVAGNTDFTAEVPTCYDAAVRIAATIEQGMSLSQVRSLVGKPVEVAIDGTNWRYQYGTDASPFVFFTQYSPTGDYYVTGYSSITMMC